MFVTLTVRLRSQTQTGGAGQSPVTRYTTWVKMWSVICFGLTSWKEAPHPHLLFQSDRSNEPFGPRPEEEEEKKEEGGVSSLWQKDSDCGTEMSCKTEGHLCRLRSHQMDNGCADLDAGRSSRAWTVAPTVIRPRSSRMWWGRQSLSWVNREMRFISLPSCIQF